MANTFKKIQTVTVGAGGASSIDFTSIPQTYTDLKIVLSARTNRASSVTDFLSITFNGSTTNRSGRELFGTGTGAGSGTVSILGGGLIVGSTATASVFGSTEIYIPNYTSANNKSLSVDSVSENNGSEAYQDLLANLWANTAAITSISIFSNNSANFVQYTTATLYGVSNVPAAGNAKATGGIITYDDTYVYHVFPWSGTFTPLQSLNVDYLVVAGGAGGVGCNNNAGAGGPGGGAGGVRCTVGATGGGGSLESQLAVTATAYTVTVGAGGAGSSGTGTAANGTNSIFSTITSIGGGGNISDVGQTGGSGGGGRVTASPGSGTTGQGFAGSSAWNGAGYPAGAGGGASEIGGSTGSDTGGQGGAGITTSISGSSIVYGGGGGGGSTSGIAGYAGAGGSGGGGAGGAAANGTNGTANRGGGGGGAGRLLTSTQFTGGAGGSGIVIVRYAK
jgi:hypothetical protein